MKKHPRILFLRGGALGDFILTLPAIQLVRSRWPKAHIELIGYPHIARLALLAGLIDRLRSLDEAEMARFFSMRPCLSNEQQHYIRSFDLVVSYLYDPVGTVRSNMEHAGAVQYIYGSPLVQSGHAIDHMLAPLAELALYPEDEMHASLPLRQTGTMDTGWPNACSETATVFIHPGSGSPTKNWPWTSFAALAGRLAAESNVQPVFVLGDAEREQGLSERAIASGHRTIQALTIPEVAASLHRGCAYVGNDSGITHLAAALGVATVAIFGPTDPARWAPRGKHVRVLHADSGDLNTLSVETVYGVLHRILETTQ